MNWRSIIHVCERSVVFKYENVVLKVSDSDRIQREYNNLRQLPKRSYIQPTDGMEILKLTNDQDKLCREINDDFPPDVKLLCLWLPYIDGIKLFELVYDSFYDLETIMVKKYITFCRQIYHLNTTDKLFHNDLHPNNIFYTDNGFVAIDFEDLTEGIPDNIEGYSNDFEQVMVYLKDLIRRWIRDDKNIKNLFTINNIYSDNFPNKLDSLNLNDIDFLTRVENIIADVE